MARIFSGRQVIKILQDEFGFKKVSQKGSHIKLKRKTPRKSLITIVPLHREIATGTLRGVLRLAEVDYKEFLKRARK